MSIVMADITDTSTGKTVGVPVAASELKLLKMPYWLAYFFSIGLGLPLDVISEAALKRAKEGDYRFSITADPRRCSRGGPQGQSTNDAAPRGDRS